MTAVSVALTVIGAALLTACSIALVLHALPRTSRDDIS